MTHLPKTDNWAIRINHVRLMEPNKKGFQKSYVLDKQMLYQRLAHRGYVKEATYQLEAGENGTLHWQLHVVFNKPMNKYQVKSTLGLLRGEYWEPCFDANSYKNYCRKRETRIEGPYVYPEYHDSIDTYLNALAKTLM